MVVDHFHDPDGCHSFLVQAALRAPSVGLNPASRTLLTMILNAVSFGCGADASAIGGHEGQPEGGLVAEGRARGGPRLRPDSATARDEPRGVDERIGRTPDGAVYKPIKPVYIRRLVRLIEAAQ